MCLLIFKPAGVTIPENHFINAMMQNSDGAGFALQLPHKRTLFIDKGLWTTEEFLKRYNGACQYYGGSPGAMIHFRFATGGRVDRTNCHPFTLSKTPIERGYADLALAHNGVLSTIAACELFSDTYHLSRQVSRLWSQKSMRKALKRHSGPSNKFVLLTPFQQHIIGEQHGLWESGVWYSNNGFRGWQSRYAWADDDYYTWEGDGMDCLFCDKPIARYRVGDTDLTLCWDCKKPLAKEMEGVPENRIKCSYCHDMVWEHTPHYCDKLPTKPLPSLGKVIDMRTSICRSTIPCGSIEHTHS